MDVALGRGDCQELPVLTPLDVILKSREEVGSSGLDGLGDLGNWLCH